MRIFEIFLSSKEGGRKRDELYQLSSFGWSFSGRILRKNIEIEKRKSSLIFYANF
jgi:hypothetical protein